MRRTLVTALSTVLLGAAFFAAASPVAEAQTSSRRQTTTQAQTATNAGAYSRVKAFVDDETFLVARLDLAQIDLEALDKTATKIFVETLERQEFDANSIKSARREFNQTFNAVKKFAEPKLAQFRDEMGLREVYFVVPRSDEPDWFVYAPLASSKRAAVSLFAAAFAPSAPFEVGSGLAFGTAKFNADYFKRFQAGPNPKLEAFLAESTATLQVFVGDFNVAPAAALSGDDAAKAFADKLAAAPRETRAAVETFDTYFVDGRFELDVNALKTSARLDFASADAANKVRVGLEKLAETFVDDVEKALAENATEGAAKYNVGPVVRELVRGFLTNSLPKRDGASLTFELQAGPTIPLTNPITGALLAASGPSAVEALASWRPDGALSALLAAFANQRAEETDVAEAETERDVLTPYVEEFGFFVSKEQLAQQAEEARAAAQAEAAFATTEDALRALSDATVGYLLKHHTMPLRYTLVDKDRPAHSWRVHLLPFLGEEALYKKIRLHEPWDSEYNSQFHAQTPAVYRRAGSKLDPTETKACFVSCLADRSSALAEPSSPGDIIGANPAIPSADGRPGAILYYERPDAVCWMDPNADGDVAFLQKLRESENGVLTVRDGGVLQRFQAVSSSIKNSGSVAETAARSEASFQADREFRNALAHAGSFDGGSYWAKQAQKDAEPLIKPRVHFKAPFMSVEATRNRRNIRFRNISHALENFIRANNALPARYSADETGKPLHSWRVHLLPYFPGQIYRNLYAKIRLDEPWDSEYNRQFHSQVPDAYREILSPKGTSTVVCVVDERGLFTKPAKAGSPLGAPVKGNFSDDPDVTLAVVDSLKPVCWMDPNANMSFETFVASVAASNPDLEAISLGLTCEPFGIPSNADPALLGGLVTRDGDELIDTFAYPSNP